MEILLSEKEIKPAIMIDCSHGNSKKNYKNQNIVLKQTIENMSHCASIIGVMIESNIVEGKQILDPQNVENFLYGRSITDSCISIQETYDIIKNYAYLRI